MVEDSFTGEDNAFSEIYLVLFRQIRVILSGPSLTPPFLTGLSHSTITE